MIARPLLTTLLALPLLSACSRTDNEPGPGGVTVSEAKALDDAAAMLESRTDPILDGTETNTSIPSAK
jgi:hypothetical protein